MSEVEEGKEKVRRVSWDDLKELMARGDVSADVIRNFTSQVQARGDGVAIYRCNAMDSSSFGHYVYASFGSAAAQIGERDPTKLPDRLPVEYPISWSYLLDGYVAPRAA